MPPIKSAQQALNGAFTEQPVAIQVLDRAMRLLDALARQSDPVTLKELAETTACYSLRIAF